jgi:hypothetical protein
MKKIILLVAAVALTLSSCSQELEFGLKAGLSADNIKLNNTNGLTTSVEGNNTFNFGAYGRFKVMVIGLFVQPEIIFNKRASNITLTDNGKSYTFSHSANYIDVPVLVGFKMLKLFRIYGGPNFQFMTKQNTDINSLNNADFQKVDLKKNTTGVQLGVGLDLLKFRVDAKYDFNAGSMGSAFSYKDTAPTITNGMITLQVGFKLFGIL